MIEFERIILDNGLRIIYHEDKSTPLVCMNILYDVGARDEDENHTGFAHLFEHLMFGGSINIPSYDEPLQMAGGENNAFTNNDITNYYLTLPAENAETAFWLESDRMLSLAFTTKSLEVQRQVVIEEFKQRYLNQPYGDVALLLKPLAYKVHPYRWNTIGKEISHIENATMDEVKSFFKKYYHPGNAIMVVAGNISRQQVEQWSNKWFGPIEAKPKAERNLPKEPIQTEARKQTVYRDVPANSIYKAWHICNRKDKSYHHFDLISDILSNGKSSRLYLSLVKEKKMFTDISAYVSGDMDNGLFIVSGKLTQGTDVEEAEKEIDQHVYYFTNQTLSENELQKVKNKVESLLEFSNTNILNKAMALAYFELLGNADMLNAEGLKYAQITVDDIRNTAQKYFKPENSVTLYYLMNQLKEQNN
ncbi:MAG: insulinase family protein [Bacteroidia bacterium]|nr:insulinase family protein [Bacteroidia bacterium]